ncbi:sulfatase [Rhabdobacter roseus]|uniref:Putative sulfatase n=1 Tax=Rhabdobacter roseus TaxID=1655419 RepID=A0A840TIR9_9BACT|nr:sulfatase [Rhabdobacter roseus]MBB5284076.1 putative sulfatase [Rhabdobacter roseus]
MKILPFLLLILVSAGFWFEPPLPPKRPNILLVISDDQSFAHTSISGCSFVRTPHFDRVAREGTLFTNAYVTSPGCSPSRASLLTGRYPWQIAEAGTHASSFPQAYVVFPDRLEAAGYRVGFTGKGWGPGDWRVSGRSRNPAGEAYQKKTMAKAFEGVSTCDYAANFADFYAQKAPGQPFYFWLGTQEPHRPFERDAYQRVGKDLAQAQVPGFLPEDSVVQGDLLDYAVEVEYLDEQLGKVLAFLEEKKELDNTIIVVTSDNGMAFPAAKANCFEYGVHVPLAIRWGQQGVARQVVKQPVSLVDLTPTFLEVAGVPTQGLGLSGRSLLPTLRGKKRAEARPVYFGRERHSSARYQNHGYPQRGVREGKYLYIHNFRPERWPAGDPQGYDAQGQLVDSYADIDACPTLDQLLAHRHTAPYDDYLRLATAQRPAEELYDLEKDPYCRRNLAAEAGFEQPRRRLQRQLFSYLRSTQDARVVGPDPEVFETYPRLQGPIRKFPESNKKD